MHRVLNFKRIHVGANTKATLARELNKVAADPTERIKDIAAPWSLFFSGALILDP